MVTFFPKGNFKSFVMSFIRCKKIHENAQLPRWSAGDAGYDLFSVGGSVIEPHEKKLIDIGISVAIPDGFVGFVWPRSGVSSKTGLTTDAGVIDASYRGELKVLLINTSSKAEVITSGTRIAQLVIVPIYSNPPMFVNELDETVRGEGGFGSTGNV